MIGAAPAEISNFLKEAVPGLQVCLEVEMGASTAGYRQRVRNSIYNRYPDPAVLDLKTPTRKINRGAAEDLYCSIAHCRSLGGYLLSSRLIGFDLEETIRITDSIARRIRHPEDPTDMPAAVFWTAKEAAFKGLRDAQPRTTSEIVITSWEKKSTVTYTYATTSGSGVVGVFPAWTVAVFEPVSN